MSFRTRSRASLGNTRYVGQQQQEQLVQQQTNASRTTQNISENILRVPILDMYNQNQYTVGNMVLNTADSLLYYHTGHQWIPLAIGNNVHLENDNVVIKAPDTRKAKLSYAETLRVSSSGNICLVAGNNVPGIGGNVHISTGQGGCSDGEICFDIGGERVLTIEKTGNLQVDSGDVIVKSGNLELKNSDACINCNISRTEVTVIKQETLDESDPATLHEDDDPTTLHESDPATLHEDDDPTTLNEDDPATVTTTVIDVEPMSIPDATLNGMVGILTINLELYSGGKISGIVHNKLLRKDSWVGVTCVGSENGIPYIWLSAPQNNMISYHIYCLDGNLNRIELHFDIRGNSKASAKLN